MLKEKRQGLREKRQERMAEKLKKNLSRLLKEKRQGLREKRQERIGRAA